MKVITTAILLLLVLNFQTMAQEPSYTNTNLPTEYVGYIIYQELDSKGNTVVIKNPVKYKLQTASSDNDENYKYRNYRIESERLKKQRSAQDKNNEENKRINSAAYYPLYFD